MKITDTTRRAVLDALTTQDWAAFEPERDLLPLRTALRELERAEGVGEAHRLATERIRERGALLRHPDAHRVEISTAALSPSGRYLAVGDFGGDVYEDGATLAIWEVATGRCVNVIDGFVGGIGWPGYGRTLQWSANETRLAVMYRSNNIGIVDPFGDESGEPDVTARLTYNGRPDPFAFAPDGQRAYALDEGSDTGGSIVTFPGLETTTVPVLDHEEEAEEEEDEDDTGFMLQWPAWSQDGKRLYGGLWDGRLCSIDVASGEVIWIVQGEEDHWHPSAAWNRDETLFAYRRDGELVIADAATGRDVALVPGFSDVPLATVHLSWGNRLAVVVPAGHRGDRAYVAIVDPAGRRCYDLDVDARDGHDMITPWAWAPDGDRAAFLTADGRIEVWSMGDERAERVGAFVAPKQATGLVWGADEVLVALGETVLHFVRADTGEVVGDTTLLRQPAAERPLLLDDDDMGEEVWPGPNPTFALDERTWAVAFREGIVIAPPGREQDLAETLAWVVDRRCAWPVHWGRLDVFPDARAAAAECEVGEPLDELLEPFLDATEPVPVPAPGAWPPPGPDTVDDLFAGFLEAVVAYGVDELPWTGEALHEAALIRARRGEPDGVRALVEASPERRRPFVAAEAAMFLVSAGRQDDARSLLAEYEAACESQWADPDWYPMHQGSQARAAAAVGGAYAALGDTERADRWFRTAREALRGLHDSWDHRLPVVWALLECGREVEAQALLEEATGDPGDTAGVPFIAYALRKGQVDLVERILRDAENWFHDWTVVALLRQHGQDGLLREWAERNNLAADEPADQADEDLARRYAEITQIPPAKRQVPTADLLIRAARQHRLDAVLALLPKLPMPTHGGMSSHDRPFAAFNALRIVTTGIDHETW
ncbi:WD40 repeat domain-containing protein [Actinomadura oligospora]|uniref:WD40 repeat domain-containing protein n=1 Tax=Actinomadura oligospora TaxID=111804 RepID=UPI00047B2CD9|nr:WD40 repeat domain-containing protein [Actinomadura oligospora]